jgi:uncharacterized protein YjbI with pentapeptide repeats
MKLPLGFIIIMLPFVIMANGASNEPLRVVQASEILAKIENEMPVNYNNAIIKSTVNLYQLDLPNTDSIMGYDRVKLVNSSIKITNSIFEENVDFGNALFRNRMEFENTTFNGLFDNWKAIFEGPTTFKRCRFLSAGFKEAHFNNYTSFEWCTFKDANFDGSEFNKHVSFLRVRFGTDNYGGNSVKFLGTEFQDGVDFWASSFNIPFYFHPMLVNDSADFNYAKFNKRADFGGEFKGDVDFGKSTFNSSVSFNVCEFKGFVDFSYSRFLNDCEFMKTSFYKNIEFNHVEFYGSLTFEDISFNNIYINWDNIKDIPKTFDAKVYASLMGEYKMRGFYNEADECYYQFRSQLLNQRNPLMNPLAYLIDYFGYILYGFGTKPENPIFWSIIVIVIAGFYWRRILRRTKNENMYRISVEDWLGFSAAVFLSGTKLFVDPPSMPEYSGKSRWIKRIFILERALGALISILLFLTVSRLFFR